MASEIDKINGILSKFSEVLSASLPAGTDAKALQLNFATYLLYVENFRGGQTGKDEKAGFMRFNSLHDFIAQPNKYRSTDLKNPESSNTGEQTQQQYIDRYCKKASCAFGDALKKATAAAVEEARNPQLGAVPSANEGVASGRLRWVRREPNALLGMPHRVHAHAKQAQRRALIF